MKASIFVIGVLILISALCTSAVGLPKKVDSDLNCQLCQVIVAITEQLIPKGETPDQMVKFLEKECAALPSYQLECKIIVDTYGRKIVTELINKAPPQNVCRDLTLCPKNMSHYSAISKPVKEAKYPVMLNLQKKVSEPTGIKKPASVPCEVCKLVMAELEKFIQTNATEAQIKKALEQACGALPKTVQPICTAFIDTYGQQIIDLLVKQLPPSQVCASLGLCKKAVEIPKAKNDIACEVCQFILGEIEKYIQVNSTEQQITNVVEQICTLLPKAYGGICKAFIDQYSKQIIEGLVAKYPPKQICKQIGVCKKNDSLPIIGKSQNSITCEVCKYIITEIDKYIGQNSSVSQIIATVERICSHLPITLKSTCDTFIEQYGPMIITYLVNKYPADQVCAAMGVCKQNEMHILPVKPEKVGNPIYCAVCKLVITEAEKFISQNSTEQQIIVSLEKACAALPKAYSGICTAFVDQYGPQVIQLLLNKYPADQICKALGICANSTIIKVAAPKHKSENSVFCAACEYILTEIDKYLGSNATEKEIVSVIEHICNLLPLKMQDVCDAFIEEYGPSIINLLINKIQPEAVCKTMKLCTSKTNIITLVNLYNGKSKNKIPMV